MKTALYRLFGALALQPRQTLRGLVRLPRYWSDRRAFAAGTDEPLQTWPCLLDRDAEASSLGEYFWQDLHVARRIIEAAPQRHVDVGSRIDGFIAHLACVRPVEVFDIRPLTATIPNVRFRQWDLMQPGPSDEQADCVSCLHTLEHIGLGRYGDPVDAQGWKTALARLASLVAPGGRLWLAVPVGRRCVAFNAHRVFEAREVLAEAARHGLACAEFGVLAPAGHFERVEGDAAFEVLARRDYALGLFVLDRPAGVA
jgi:hypothetical protein